MERLTIALGTCIIILQSFAYGIFEEPVCSKYHFEEKVLEKLILLEIRVENDFKHLREEASARDAKLSALADSTKHDVASLTEKISKFKNMHEVIAKGQDVVEKKKDPVFFVAYSTSESLAQHQPVVYQKTVVNHGSHYDKSTGKFTAPVKGVYIFSAQICSVNYVRYQIVVNDTPYSASRQYDKVDGVCSSVSTTALVARGGQVWVNISNSGVKVKENLHVDPYWNMFTGTLVMIVE